MHNVRTIQLIYLRMLFLFELQFDQLQSKNQQLFQQLSLQQIKLKIIMETQVWTVADLINKPNDITLKLIGQLLCVSIQNGSDIDGYLHTVDPVSGTLVLLQFSSNNEKMIVKLVNSSIIEKVRLSHHTENQTLNEIQRLKVEKVFLKRNSEPSAMETEEEKRMIQNRKQQIIQCLQQNLIPFEEKENNTLMVGQALKIKYPYRKEDFESSNEIVLKRTLDMLQNVLES